MPKIYIARKANRIGYYLPMSGRPDNPSLTFPLTKHLENSELDELVRAQLEKQGVSSESAVQKIADEAEAQYEFRVKVQETRKEIRRLMDLKREGKKLMQVGFRKWKEAYYPARKVFKKDEITKTVV